MEKADFRTVDSVHRINKEDWQRVFGDIPEGYEFYKTLEDSGLEEFRFCYGLLYLKGKLVLIAPLFVSDFNLDIAVEGWLKSLIISVRRFFPRFLTVKTLFCGSPFGEKGVIGLSGSNGNLRIFINELAEGLKKLSRRLNTRLIMFKDFPKNDCGWLELLKEKGFFKVGSFPSAMNELYFKSFDEYVKSLGSATRKSLRRRLKKADNLTRVEIKELDNVDGAAEEVFSLYLNTYRQGMTKFERLTKEFFLSVGRNMQPHVKIFLYYVNGKMGAFNLCLVYKDLFIDKFIGFDYDISGPSDLYFLSWCHNIDWCIKNSIRYYQSGQTDYCAKVRLGSRLVPLYAYLRHANFLMNIILHFLSLMLKPDNFDKDIKKTGHG